MYDTGKLFAPGHFYQSCFFPNIVIRNTEIYKNNKEQAVFPSLQSNYCTFFSTLCYNFRKQYPSGSGENPNRR